jgi:hypothetical protein
MSTITGGIGDVRWSMLDEQLFQEQNGPFWWLVDGRSIAGTALAALRPDLGGVLPDQRGEFPRAADAGRGLDSQALNATINIGTGVFTLTGMPTSPMYSLSTGQTTVLSTTGSLPTGVVAATKYYVIALTATTFKLASTPANALAGTAIALSGSQSGTQTATLSRVAGSHQVEDFKTHTHTDSGHTHTDAGHTHNTAGSFSVLTGLGSNVGGGNGFSIGTVNPLTATGAAAIQSASAAIQSTSGAGGGGETRPRNNAFFCYVRVN